MKIQSQKIQQDFERKEEEFRQKQIELQNKMEKTGTSTGKTGIDTKGFTKNNNQRLRQTGSNCKGCGYC